MHHSKKRRRRPRPRQTETEAELRRYWIDVKGIKDKGQPASTASPNNSGLYFEMDAAAG